MTKKKMKYLAESLQDQRAELKIIIDANKLVGKYDVKLQNVYDSLRCYIQDIEMELGLPLTPIN